MATVAPDDQSDYGFDEDVFDILIANSEADEPLPHTATHTRFTGGEPAATETRDTQSAAASVLDFLSESDLLLDGAELASDASHRHVALAGADGVDGSHEVKHGHKRKLVASAARDDGPLAAYLAKTKARSTPTAFAGADVRYPDLSRMLAEVQAGAVKNGSETPDPAPKLKPTTEDVTQVSGDGSSASTDTRSPLLRFRTFPKKPFSVSDLTAGNWCELQYYYTLTKLGGKKTRTAAMKGGTKVHQKLEKELYTTVKIEVKKKEDAFGLRIWNIVQGLRTLRETGLTREMEVWGFVDGNVVNGVIDLLTHQNPDPDLEEDVKSSASSQESKQQPITNFFAPDRPRQMEVFVVDIKTRASASPPSKSAAHQSLLQLFLYHRLLSDMASDKVDYIRIFERYGLNPDELFSDQFLAQVGELHDEVFTDAPSTPRTSESDGPNSGHASSGSVSQTEAASGVSTFSHRPDLLNYRSLRALKALLTLELRLTFTQGAGSLGQIVSVEYHQRPRDDDDGTVKPGPKTINTTAHFVQPWILDQYISKCMQWWRGEREPRGVSLQDTFKCRFCEFAADCEWRDRLDKEALSKAKAKSMDTKVASSSQQKMIPAW